LPPVGARGGTTRRGIFGAVGVMTVHKLSAGDGYTYLTRQVASADERRSPGQSLAEHYVARGNPPGVWMGSGAAQLDIAGSEVSEAQMRALFARGMHPDGRRRLGAAYPNYAELAPYADRVAARIAAGGHHAGSGPAQRVVILDADNPMDEIHGEFFWRQDHDRIPAEERRRAYEEGLRDGVRRGDNRPINVTVRPWRRIRLTRMTILSV